MKKKITRKQAVENHFNEKSDQYLKRYLNFEKIREKERILEILKSKDKFKKILDIGCGPGIISEDLLEVGDEIWGIDISEDMIKVANEKKNFNDAYKDKLHFEVGDAENLKYPDNYFDVVICLGVLRFLTSYEGGLKEIHRVLKPNGIILVTFFYRFSPHWFSMVFLYRPFLPLIHLFKRKPLTELGRIYKAEPLPFSYLRFKKIFNNIGFKNHKTFHSGFFFYPFNILFPKISTKFYLKAESYFFNSKTFGWLGSICMVKGTKQNV